MKPIVPVETYDVYKKGAAFSFKEVKSLTVFGDYPDQVDFTLFILTYKRPESLKYAVRSALNQIPCGMVYRIIVLDNSGYGTQEQEENERLLRNFKNEKLVYFANETNIMGENWNRPFELSHSQYVGVLHDDDVLYEDYFCVVEALLKAGVMDNTAMLLSDKDYVLASSVRDPSLLENSVVRTDQRIIVDVITEQVMLLRGYSLQNAPSPGGIFDCDAMLKAGGYPSDAGPKGDDVPAWSLVRQYKIKTTRHFSFGKYVLLQNDSLNIETMKNIVLFAMRIHKCVYQKNRFWKMYYRLFATSLYTSQVNTQLKTASSCSLSIKPSDFHPFKYKSRKIRLRIMKALLIVRRLMDRRKREYYNFSAPKFYGNTK